MVAGYSAGSTSAPSRGFINFGNADSTAPTLIHANGTSTFTGYGSIDFQLLNAKNYIFGVPAEDTAPDNTTLTATNYINFVTGRRSGASARRNAVQANDTLGGLTFYGQTGSSSTSIGTQGAYITARALDTFTGSAQGSRISIGTANSGTTFAAGNTLRLQLDSEVNYYRSKVHNFGNYDGSGNSLAYFSPAYTAINAQTIELKDSAANVMATFTTASVTINNLNLTGYSISGVSSSSGIEYTGMTATATTYTLFSYDNTVYTGAKFVIKVNDLTDLHMTEMLVINDTTNSTSNEYAVVTNNGDLGTFSIYNNGTDVQLNFTTRSVVNSGSGMTARITATLLE